MFNVFFAPSGYKRSIGIVNTHDEAFRIIDAFLFNYNYQPHFENCRHPDEKTVIVDVDNYTGLSQIKGL